MVYGEILADLLPRDATKGALKVFKMVNQLLRSYYVVILCTKLGLLLVAIYLWLRELRRFKCLIRYDCV